MAVFERRLGRLGTMTEGSLYARVAKTNDLDHEGNLPLMTNVPDNYYNITNSKVRQLDNDIVEDGGNLPNMKTMTCQMITKYPDDPSNNTTPSTDKAHQVADSEGNSNYDSGNNKSLSNSTVDPSASGNPAYPTPTPVPTCDCITGCEPWNPDPKTYTFDAPLFNKSGAIGLLLDTASPLCLNGTALSINLSNYALVKDIPDVSGFANKSDLSIYATLVDLQGYARLSDLPDTAQISKNTAAIQALSDKKQDKLPDNSLGLKSRVQISDIATTGSGTADTFLAGDGSWKPAYPADYATQCDLKQFITEAQADARYQPIGDYATKADIPDVSQFAKECELPKPDGTTITSNDGVWTAHSLTPAPITTKSPATGNGTPAMPVSVDLPALIAAGNLAVKQDLVGFIKGMLDKTKDTVSFMFGQDTLTFDIEEVM